MQFIWDNSPTLHSLVYRRQLVCDILNQEIKPFVESSSFFALVGVSLRPDPHLGPVTLTPLLRIGKHRHPINVLRGLRKKAIRYELIIANRDDVTDQRLLKDHSLYDTLCLVYGLCMFSTMIIYENDCRSKRELTPVVGLLSQLLLDLSGVFDNGEAQWICPLL